VITPTFNRANTLSETLVSIQAQTYRDWECLVVDDGSTDSTFELVNTFMESDSRIHLLSRSREPKGACVCRNIGVERATGEYVIFLDSDDVIAPHCLEQRVKAFAEAGDVDFVVFPALTFRAHPGDDNYFWNVLTAEPDLDRFLQLDSPWQGTGPMWKRESFIRVGGWAERLACWQDVELSLRCFEKGMSYRTRYDLPPDLFIRRGDGTTVSSAALRSPEKLASKREVLARALSLSQIRAEGWNGSAAKVLASTVIMDFARGRAPGAAVSLASQNRKNRVFSVTDWLIILCGIAAHSRVGRHLPGSASVQRIVAGYFGSQSTIGRVKYFSSSASQYGQ
jgi:hypothetical protein